MFDAMRRALDAASARRGTDLARVKYADHDVVSNIMRGRRAT